MQANLAKEILAKRFNLNPGDICSLKEVALPEVLYKTLSTSLLMKYKYKGIYFVTDGYKFNKTMKQFRTELHTFFG